MEVSAFPDDVSKHQLSAVKSKQMVRFRLFLLLFAIDSAGVLIACMIVSTFRAQQWMSLGSIDLWMVLLPIYFIIAFNKGAYTLKILRVPVEGVRRANSSVVYALLAVLFVMFFTRTSSEVSRLGVFMAGMLSCGFVVAGRFAFGSFARRMAGGTFTNLMIVYDGVPSVPSATRSVLDAGELGLYPDTNDPVMLHRLGTLLARYDSVAVCTVPERRADWALILKGLHITGEIIVPKNADVHAIGVGNVEGQDTLIVSRGPLNLANRTRKRILDLLLTVPIVVAVTPLMVLIAIAIKLDSSGPVFFLQHRLGRGNRMFRMMKFRSMRTDQLDFAGAQSASRADDRITRVGRLIRRTSLDELPQLLNVLLGDMSLVGPRPHALGSTAGDLLFWEVDQRYWLRHALKPGITGLAQVRGHRGATLVRADLERRLQADLEYLDNWSVWGDVAILLSTVRVIVHKNAF